MPLHRISLEFEINLHKRKKICCIYWLLWEEECWKWKRYLKTTWTSHWCWDKCKHSTAYTTRKRAINSIYSTTYTAAFWCWKSNKLLFPYVCEQFISFSLFGSISGFDSCASTSICSNLRKMYITKWIKVSISGIHFGFHIKLVWFPDKWRVVLCILLHNRFVSSIFGFWCFRNWYFMTQIFFMANQ